MPIESLWKHADFLKLWTGQTVSQLGSVVTRTALPLVALLVLGAGPLQLAVLVISARLAGLLVGLVAGAWVDRLRRRPILIWTDVIRAALLFWIPIAYAIGALRIEQLYAVAFIEAGLGSLFDAAYPAYVPTLVGTDRVVDANSKLATSASIGEIRGPGFAGTPVQSARAPFAIAVRVAGGAGVGHRAGDHLDGERRVAARRPHTARRGTGRGRDAHGLPAAAHRRRAADHRGSGRALADPGSHSGYRPWPGERHA